MREDQEKGEVRWEKELEVLYVVKDEREEDARPSWVAIEELCGSGSALVRPGGGQLQMRTRNCDGTALPDPLVLSSGYMLQFFNSLFLPHRADFFCILS